MDFVFTRSRTTRFYGARPWKRNRDFVLLQCWILDAIYFDLLAFCAVNHERQPLVGRRDFGEPRRSERNPLFNLPLEGKVSDDGARVKEVKVVDVGAGRDRK